MISCEGNDHAVKNPERKRTKILCTLGPSCVKVGTLRDMINVGMDGARLNCSHGDRREHRALVKAVRAAEKAAGRPVALVFDLQGAKVRIGEMEEGGALLKPGQALTITTEKVAGNSSRVSTDHTTFPSEVEKGETISLADGEIRLRVTGVSKKDVDCVVIYGGVLQSHKGINYRRRGKDVRPLTGKDWEDLKFAIEAGADFVAVSFVASGKDISEVRGFLAGHGSDIHVIAKVERSEALKNLDGLITAADGIMVARGDLGLEIPIEDVPLVQKKILSACAASSKLAITATHMLESMIWNPVPTRAEVLDIANAVIDGTDALMLSGETAVGKYPVDAVRTMASVAKRAESISKEDVRLHTDLREDMRITNTVGHAACLVAENLRAQAIIPFTLSGSTARLISKYRPHIRIMAATPEKKVMRRTSLYWGVEPLLVDRANTTDKMIAAIERTMKERKHLRKGDLCVITAGVPLFVRGRTNMIKVHRIGSGHWDMM
jgi:pyruvate kinase